MTSQKSIVLTCILFLLSSTTLSAQEQNFALRHTLSPTWTWINAASSRASNQAFNDGRATWVHTQFYLGSPEGQTDLGLSEEQRQRLAFLEKDQTSVIEN